MQICSTHIDENLRNKKEKEKSILKKKVSIYMLCFLKDPMCLH